MPFWPGPGLGGHCIPVDPFYLTWRAKAFDMTAEFVELAGRVNVNMPHYAVQRITRALNTDGRPIRGSRILLLGVSYKPDVGDVRESPSLKLIELLRADGGEVTYHDPYVAELEAFGLRSVPLTEDVLREADLVVIATNHRAVDLAPVVACARRIVDLRDAVRQSLGGTLTELPAHVDVL
jgi:UDP-N-acetyl-D-glucosamine dehydrogenase